MALGSITIQFSSFLCPFLLLRQQLWAILSFILLEDYGMQELKIESRYVKVFSFNLKIFCCINYSFDVRHFNIFYLLYNDPSSFKSMWASILSNILFSVNCLWPKSYLIKSSKILLWSTASI